MFAMPSIIQILTTVAIFEQIYCSGTGCPSQEIMAPCICNQVPGTSDNYNQILCGGNENLNLSQIFKNMSQELHNDRENDLIYYMDFYLNNTGIEELPRNVFADIHFTNVVIKSARSLSKISPKTFEGTNDWIITLKIIDTPIDNTEDLLSAIKSLPVLLDLSIQLQNLTHIPDQAFNEALDLDIISIHNNIESIGSNVFNNPGLLDLSYNRINSINDYWFASNTTTNRTLFLNLAFNQLNETNVRAEQFLGFKRPVHLVIDGNRFHYLNETIFGGFLRNNKLNRLSLPVLDCNDCRNVWLKQHLNSQICVDAMCSETTDRLRCSAGNNDVLAKCK